MKEIFVQKGEKGVLCDGNLYENYADTTEYALSIYYVCLSCVVCARNKITYVKNCW